MPPDFPVPDGMVIQFVEFVEMPQPAFSPAERLIDQGHMIRYAERYGCKHAREAVSQIPPQKKALALLAVEATRECPALMFKAMMEGWSEFKVRFEVNKLRGKAGK